MGNYTETSLAIVEYKLNELYSQRDWIDERIRKLIKVRDNCIKALTDEHKILTPDEVKKMEEELS